MNVFYGWNEVFIARYQDGNFICPLPSETNEIGHDSRIYRLLGCATEWGAAARANFMILVARAAMNGVLAPMTFRSKNANASLTIQGVVKPIFKFGLTASLISCVNSRFLEGKCAQPRIGNDA
ncbi:MAG TPA: hypothetical protein PK156_04885 [Polyangium sp.]|nr:hypothetical protein [Polyangium sp.]